jgi:hypothetical protein
LGLPALFRSRGSGWAGWPSYSHGPASIDLSGTHPLAVSLSHRPRSPRAQLLSRTGTSRCLVMIDHPRLVGWSSLHPAHRQSLTPLCRRSGTVSSVPGPTAGWLDALSCDEAPCVDPRDRDRHPAPPCGAAGAPIGTPSTVSRSTGVASSRRALRATWFGSVARLAHRFRFEAAAVCVSTPSESP